MKQNRFENFNVYTRSSTRIAAVGVTALALFAASAKDGVPIIKKAVEPGIALADTLPFTDTIVTPVDGTSVSGEIEITTDPKDPLGTVNI
jgi:ABC-type sugar transport system substrate-binding protein